MENDPCLPPPSPLKWNFTLFLNPSFNELINMVLLEQHKSIGLKKLPFRCYTLLNVGTWTKLGLLWGFWNDNLHVIHMGFGIIPEVWAVIFGDRKSSGLGFILIFDYLKCVWNKRFILKKENNTYWVQCYN